MKFCSYCKSFVTSADICNKCGNAVFFKVKILNNYIV